MKRVALFFLLVPLTIFAYDKPDWEGGYPDGCTSVTVGKKATAGGWVTTSHTCDSHRTRAYLTVTPAADHKKGSMLDMVKRDTCNTFAMPTYKHVKVGEIPQVEHTHKYFNSAYACMNEHQLAIGESTFGGRETLQSEKGFIDCQQLCRLMLERCVTARDAIELTRDLVEKYGYNDAGECLTISDPQEVWQLEIVGPGQGNVGGVWVAQRVPDDHVSVNANASRIRQIDFDNPDYFLYSDNITQVAQDSGWWNPENGEFEFCYAYGPEGRTSMAARRREWRVFDLVAPSLELDANAENYPFSVKPDSLVTMQKLVDIFKDYYEGTPYNFVKDLTVADDSGKVVLSPLANPFMPYDMNKLFKINGGWGWRGERTIARWYTMYATITQSRENMPNDIGGVVWYAFDNVANSIYVPLYIGINDVAEPFKTAGRPNGYTRDSAWWAFNRLGTLAAQRWGDMRHDVDAVFVPMQTELFNNQKAFEEKALTLYKKSPKKAQKMLTDYAITWGDKVVDSAWRLGDDLWTKYDEKF